MLFCTFWDVNSGLSSRCLFQFSYAIGVAKPLSIYVDKYGTGKVPNEIFFDLSPDGIIRDLDLLRPIYAQTATYGHFGRTDID